ncbi:hypothetical protein Ahy_A04g020605 [Arachis hypogaea]|uniref:Protein FAR1-RELATED SEQUENCE n=1 Tax=Arachis hypogaea TaxID=3818 RepID=A0A445DI53_ARAHY|nr:hypothetical protein Ahy_A04g020605 [Arachis hypogaea]
MKKKNHNFFFELELEVDQSIKIAFWADARSRAIYEYFGDAISFDTTYNTNNMTLGTTNGFERAERERIKCCRFHTVISCATKFSIEAQFQQVYTHEKFREVQAQFRVKTNCITRSMHSALGYMSKNVKRRHTNIKSSHDEPLLEPRSKRFDDLVFHSQNIYEFASEFEELTTILHHTYDNAMVEMQEHKAKKQGKSSLSHEDASLEDINELQSPPHMRTRGCPKNRLGSKTKKQIANASKKKKTKALRELNLFYGGLDICGPEKAFFYKVTRYFAPPRRSFKLVNKALSRL